MTTRTGVVIRILAGGIAIILVINYGFKTSRAQEAAKNRITGLQLELSHARAKLGQADVQVANLQRHIEELTIQLASRSRIEKQLRKSIPIKAQAEPAAPPKARGLITAILYTLQGSSVVIDDVILYEGNVIHGVTITKIHQDSVEFAKGAHRWSQQIHQSPPPIWTEKKQIR